MNTVVYISATTIEGAAVRLMTNEYDYELKGMCDGTYILLADPLCNGYGYKHRYHIDNTFVLNKVR